MPARQNDPAASLALIRRALAERQAADAARSREAAREAALRERESRMFRQAIADVVPLPPAARAARPQPKPAPLPAQGPAAAAPAPPHGAALSDGADIDTPGHEADDAGYARAGIDPRMLRRLRRGEWRVQAQVDLHGMTRDDARQAVAAFVAGAVASGLRCVRIVHGKGLGSAGGAAVLKSLARRWLAQTGTVVAFAEPREAEGGAGATLVLLEVGGGRPGGRAAGAADDPHAR